MQDQRTLREIIHQMDVLEKNNTDNIEYITSIDLLLTSNDNGTVKDSRLSDKFNKLKETIQEANQLSKEFITILKQNH